MDPTIISGTAPELFERYLKFLKEEGYNRHRSACSREIRAVDHG